MGSVFNTELETVLQHSGLTVGGLTVPGVVVQTLEKVRSAQPAPSRDLFKSQGDLPRVQRVMEEYDRGEVPKWSEVTCEDAIGVMTLFLMVSSKWRSNGGLEE